MGYKTDFAKARNLSWQTFGKKITFYLPGMFHYNNMTGQYPAISITGGSCELQCDHCRGKILSSMVQAPDPDTLVAKCRDLEKKGHIGVLLSGGSDLKGRLPWEIFVKAIRQIKQTTHLLVSVHSGFLSYFQAEALKKAGVDQVLIDVIADERTFETICHLPFTRKEMKHTLTTLTNAGLSIVPHIVCGVYQGQIRGEYEAVDLLKEFSVDKLVIVSLMGIDGTPMAQNPGPSAEQVADVIAYARIMLPNICISLGCARKRGDRQLEILAIQCGVNGMALPSDEAIEMAMALGLKIKYQKTCCSVSQNYSTSTWA